VSGGSDTHLILMDLSSKDLTGKDVEKALDEAGITVNKNTVPFDTKSPFVTSGIRLGSPALTTRGFKEDDFKKVAAWIVAAIESMDNETRLSQIRGEVRTFARQFPLFTW
jgi:glycine hydroxymethyltransferase